MKFIVYRRNLGVLVVPYWTLVWSPLVTHKNASHSHAKHWTRFVCLLIYSDLKFRFWVYQNSEALGAWTVSWCSHKKRLIKLVPGTVGLHCWLAYLSLYPSGKLLLRNSATLIKIRTLDHFVWRRKWYCCLFKSVTSSILPSHHGVSACNCLFCDKEGLCYFIWLRAHLSLGCLRHAVLLYEEFPGFIIECNMQQIVIADWSIVSIQNVQRWTPSYELSC